MKIKNITALEILDSRGLPTVRTTVTLENGTQGVASVPSGASTGSHEAHELRDKDPKRFGGKGVLNAVHNIETEIAPALEGKESEAQEEIDKLMIDLDGTPNKSRLGANAILAVSLATAVATARAQQKELYEYVAQFFGTTTYTMPVPMINVINGGKHAPGSADIQEFMLIPYGFQKYSEALRASAEVFQILKKKLKEAGHSTSVGDEGGYAPVFPTNEAPFQFLVDAIQETGYVPGTEFGLGLDGAASEFYHDGIYHFETTNIDYTSAELITYYQGLIEKYPIVSLEDHFQEDDWDGFKAFNAQFGDHIQTVGDDLYVTNMERLQRGIAEKTTNAILIKLNQIGTLTETIGAMKLAKNHNMEAIVSHRSGETEDTFIADLVVASGAGQIKTGSMSRSERLAKYNRLLEIEHREKAAVYYQFPYKK